MILLNYLFFSTIEFAAGLCIILAMFMFPIKEYIPHIAFTSIILTQASYLVREVLHLQAIAPIVQIVMMIFFLWLMFRVQVFYAAVMVTIGYIAFVLVQFLIIFFGQLIHIFTFDQVLNDVPLGHYLQLTNSFAAFIICWMLRKYRIGFSFVPDNERDRIEVNGLNLYLLASIVLAISLLAFLYQFTSIGIFNILSTAFLSALILGGLLYFAVKKERK